jgi:hypothetical protein
MDDCFPFVFQELSGQQPVNQLLYVGISQVKPVTRAIAKESIVAVSGANNAPGFVLFLDHEIILFEMKGAGEAGQAGTED